MPKSILITLLPEDIKLIKTAFVTGYENVKRQKNFLKIRVLVQKEVFRTFRNLVRFQGVEITGLEVLCKDLTPAIDETTIWNNMISNTTVEKHGTHSVNTKTTGHEKSKITVCLTATFDGVKKKPFFVFRGAKRDVKRLNEEYKARCIVTSSASGWMDEPLTEQHCHEVIETVTFCSRRLVYVAWDSFSCHLTPGVKELLSKSKVDPVIVPGGCTKYIQAPDVS